MSRRTISAHQPIPGRRLSQRQYEDLATRKMTSSKWRIIKDHPKLLWFTPSNKVGQRFNIPSSVLELYVRKALSEYGARAKADFVVKILADPDRRWMATHPKLWWISRTIELAPLHPYREILKILQAESKERKFSSKISLPAIMDISKHLKLRTSEFRREMAKRRGPVRPENKLEPSIRKRLVDVAVEMTSARVASAEKKYPGVDAYLLDRFGIEARRFPHRGAESVGDIELGWIKFVKKRLPLWMKDALRRVGPVTRSGNVRGSIATGTFSTERSSPLELSGEEHAELSRRIKSQLTPRQFEIFELFYSGLTRVEVARKLNVTIPAVDAQLSNIRKKVRI